MLPEYSYFDPSSKETKDSNEASLDAFLRGRQTSPTIKHDKLEENIVYDKALLLSPLVRASLEILDAARDLDGASKEQKHTNRFEAGRAFTKAGEKKYGEPSRKLFIEALYPELFLLNNFIPKNIHSKMLKDGLLKEFCEIKNTFDGVEAINYEVVQKGAIEYLSPLLNVMPTEGNYGASQIADFFNEGLKAMGLHSLGWEAVVSDTRSLFTVSSTEKKVYIPSGAKKTASDIKRLAAHEIGVHASKTTKLDDDFEEGLGIAIEAIVSHPSKEEPVSIERARKRYLHLGLALGLDGNPPRNARQVFEITWRLQALKNATNSGIVTPKMEHSAKSTTLSYIQNIFRGSDYKLPGVVYMRPKVYYEGFKQAVEYINQKSTDPNWLRDTLQPEPKKGDQ